jgi:two-component system response regulator DevR
MPIVAIRVLICDDHDMVRDALARVINAEADIDVAGSTSGVNETIEFLRNANVPVDVAVVDIRLNDGEGHEVTRWIKANKPDTTVLLLTSFMEDQVLVDGYASGASAIVLKGAPTSELTDRIRDVHAGIQFIDARAAREAAQRLNDSTQHRLALLDRTEMEIAQLIATGMTDKEIASTVHLGAQTVKNRVSAILSKVGAANRTQLAVMVATTNSAQQPGGRSANM